MTEHNYYECKCGNYGCQFCDGGLGYCEVCHGFEGSLSSECPGFALDDAIQDEIYLHGLDFKDGKFFYKDGKRNNTITGLMRWLTNQTFEDRVDFFKSLAKEICFKCGLPLYAQLVVDEDIEIDDLKDYNEKDVERTKKEFEITKKCIHRCRNAS